MSRYTQWMADIIEPAVAKGAALLDKYYPGWEANVSEDTLILACPDQCILAQVTEGYYAVKVVSLVVRESGEPCRIPAMEAFGFKLPSHLPISSDDSEVCWDKLREEWLKHSRYRLEHPNACTCGSRDDVRLIRSRYPHTAAKYLPTTEYRCKECRAKTRPMWKYATL